jgi:putative glycosyltransferase (TIGR04372 family)
VIRPETLEILNTVTYLPYYRLIAKMHSELGPLSSLRSLASNLLRRAGIFRIIVLLRSSVLLFMFPVKNFKRLSNSDVEQLVNSEVFHYFSNNNKRYLSGRSYFRREWTRLAWMAMDGKYHEANLLRADLLRKAREIHGLPENYTPSIMERAWTTHFGHLACLFAFEDGQRFNILPNRRRMVLNSNTFARNRPIFRILKDSFDFLDVRSKASIFDTEPYFPLTEKVSFISADSKFLELTQFLNEIGNAHRTLNPGSRELIPFTELETSFIKALFAKNGMDDQAPFVALHIRETKDKYADRNSKALDFWPSIKYLIRNGAYVLRIGSKLGLDLPHCPGLLDLTNLGDDIRFLHDYAIANAEFFITSQSGPSAFAHLIGVPTLTVDALAIARSTYTTRAFSMSLPKKLKNNSGAYLPWESFFENEVSYRELDFNIADFSLSSNSSDDILSATKEFAYKMNLAQSASKNPSAFVAAKKSVRGNRGWINFRTIL